MAEWYSRANQKQKAIEAEQKAVETLKTQNNFSATKLAVLESQLERYKAM
jgi:hypothetical protein